MVTVGLCFDLNVVFVMPPPPVVWADGGIMFLTIPSIYACVPGRGIL